MKRLAGFIYDHSRLIIALVIVLNLLSIASFYRFSLDADFLSFFSKGNPKADEYNRISAKYESGESISVFIQSDSPLLSRDSLPKVFELQENIEAVPGISGVQSFIPTEIITPGGTVEIDEAFIESNYDAVVDFIRTKYFLTDQFLAPEGTSAILVSTLEIDASSTKVIDSLEGLIESSPFDLSLAGNEVIRDTMSNYLLLILVVLPPCAIVLVLLVFYLALRNARLTILSMIPAGFAALWTFGTIFWSGQELNLLTVLSPLFILVMGSAYGLHYTSHLLDNINDYPDRRELTIATLSMVGTPIFLAAITTMAGFISLAWTEIIPMRHMGIFVTLGIGYAGLIAFFFLPAVLSRIELPLQARRSVDTKLNRFILRGSRFRVLIPAIFGIIVIVSVIFIPSLEVESSNLTYFKESSDIRRTFDSIEEQFGSPVPLTGEIITRQGPGDLLDAEFANRILSAEREMEQLPGVRSVFSVFDIVVGLNNIITGQSTYPANPMLLQSLISGVNTDEFGTWVASDGFKFIVKTEGLSSEDIDLLDQFVAEHDDLRIVTGLPVLFTEMNRLVIRSQIQSMGLALALIFIMLWATLRRVTAALAGVLPIVITICTILGVLSMTNFNINLMTANLSAIAIGVGVDYSIHLLSGVYYYRSRGLDRQDSVTAAISTVSRPVLANAFGLAIGLSALFFSPLRIHTQAATVMWVAMVVSSLAALLLVPQFYTSRKPGNEPGSLPPGM